MANPWLHLPLADYEGHMNSPGVRQLEPLAELFCEALTLRRPASVTILGIAGGNGLDRVDQSVTKRVVGLDLNPDYLEEVRRRYGFLPGLDLHCVDLARQVVCLEPVELVHAALVFEHAGTGLCLDNAVNLVSAGGAMAVVLQLPSQVEPNVSSTGYSSMQSLKSHFSLIDPTWFRGVLAARGFRIVQESYRELPATKRFWMGIFSRAS